MDGIRDWTLTFIFASAYGLARTHGCRLHASKEIIQELKDNLNMSIQGEMWISEERVKHINDWVIKDTTCTFLPELLKPNAVKHIELQGYWQSYLYFDAYRDEIRQIYSARTETLPKLFEFFFNITRIGCPTCSTYSFTSSHELRHIIRVNYNITWISIHIRRADFHTLGYASDEHYIDRAMAYYKRRYYNHQIRFLVASDDKPYCRRLFEKNHTSNQIFVLPDSFSHTDDLMALSFCHHSILTGGTYGFWTAYLAGGEVIHDNMYRIGCSRSDYYPPWFKLVGEIPPKVN